VRPCRPAAHTLRQRTREGSTAKAWPLGGAHTDRECMAHDHEELPNRQQTHEKCMHASHCALQSFHSMPQHLRSVVSIQLQSTVTKTQDVRKTQDARRTQEEIDRGVGDARVPAKVFNSEPFESVVTCNRHLLLVARLVPHPTKGREAQHVVRKHLFAARDLDASSRWLGARATDGACHECECGFGQWCHCESVGHCSMFSPVNMPHILWHGPIPSRHRRCGITNRFVGYARCSEQRTQRCTAPPSRPLQPRALAQEPHRGARGGQVRRSRVEKVCKLKLCVILFPQLAAHSAPREDHDLRTPLL
jgi:hypothetical protein